MSDDSANILGGLFLYGESQRQAQNAVHAVADLNKAQAVNDDLLASLSQASSLNGELEDEVALLLRHKQYLLNEFAKERIAHNTVIDKHNALAGKNRELEREIEKYKNILSMPMAEIASVDENFKKNYETQMELIATWMVSQKAFKELAIELGAEKGLSADAVIELGNAKKIDVLDNKHSSHHGSNADDVEVISKRIDLLKSRLAKS